MYTQTLAKKQKQKLDYNKLLAFLYSTSQFWYTILLGAILMIEQGPSSWIFGLKMFLVMSTISGSYICSATNITNSINKLIINSKNKK